MTRTDNYGSSSNLNLSANINNKINIHNLLKQSQKLIVQQSNTLANTMLIHWPEVLTLNTQTAAVESLPQGFEIEVVVLQRFQKSLSPLFSSRNPTLESSGAREHRSNGLEVVVKLALKTLRSTNRMHSP
jgi:hypothetical protein